MAVTQALEIELLNGMNPGSSHDIIGGMGWVEIFFSVGWDGIWDDPTSTY